MKEVTCNYAPIRFRPYPETCEFVNIGVVVHAPETDHFDFQLVSGKCRRVRQFFPELDRKVLATALEEMKKGLQRHTNTGGLLTPATQEEVRERMEDFRRLVSFRESLIHFGPAATLTAGDPTKALDDLYARLVLRQFAKTHEYREQVMAKRLRAWLREWQLKREYLPAYVGDEDFRIKLPFVHVSEGQQLKALKPLSFDQSNTTSIYDHGGLWVQRIRRLRDRGRLPKETVFAVDFPRDRRPRKAADEVCGELRQPSIAVVDFGDTERLHGLARVDVGQPVSGGRLL
jgi:hypothetical protein